MVTRWRASVSSDRGFTLIETVMVVAIGLILMAVTTVSVDRVVETTRGDSALYSVMSQLRTARDMAINRRRSIQVQFVKPNEILMTRFEIPSGTTTLDGSFLEGHVQFLMYPGVSDTPDGFGNSDAVDFGGFDPLFIADGTMVDTTGATLSGTVFLAIPDQPGSVRAVTVFGGTGQVRGYTYDWPTSQWVEQ